MPLDMREVDPHDEPGLRAWWEVGKAATAERPGHPWPVWEISRTALPAHNPEQDVTLIGAFDGDEMVGSSILMLPRNENLHTCAFDVYVLPSRRRAGIGTLLVADIEARAAAHARRTLLCQAYVPAGDSGPAEQFARARGFSVANRLSFKGLRFADYCRRRVELHAEVADRADGYRIITFDTVCPEDHLASYGRLLGMQVAEIPTGDLDLQDSEWTTERLRDLEHRRVSNGTHVLTALALALDGSVAGSSDVRVNEAAGTDGYVGVTLVDPAHRGHRLGLALKIATHDLALATYDDLKTVDTCNAEANEHMNAVNEALGYRSIETALELQKKI